MLLFSWIDCHLFNILSVKHNWKILSKISYKLSNGSSMVKFAVNAGFLFQILLHICIINTSFQVVCYNRVRI